ncbi:VanZ family protein [Salipaludibacillus sp. CF4.18]|uniref:VanZ family protein n=1 Tax=Salipaludibacillus sp. CF4.18 TaxID=3373081 RepID=UPI003EE5297E
MAPVKNKNRPPTFLILITFLSYMGILFYVTFFAWNYGSSFGPAGPGGRNYNLDPFLSIYRIAVFSDNLGAPFRILVGNVLLFIPFGFLFPFVIHRMKKSKQATSFFLTIFLAMLLSIFIEISQFLFTFRVANIDDVILNTLGGIIGAICYRIGVIIKLNLKNNIR